MTLGSLDDRRMVKTTPSKKNIYLDPKNPFIYNHFQEGRTQLLLEEELHIPDEFLERAYNIETRNCCVKILCICDMVMTSYYIFYNIIIGTLFFGASLSGYLSTIYYNKSLMVYYVFYQYFLVFCRTSTVILVCYIYQNYIPSVAYYNETNSSLNNTIQYDEFKIFIIGNEVIDVTYLSLMVVFQVCIAFYIKEYYDLLPSEQEKNRIIISSI